MREITTILFDVDGTLLDTGEFILQATEHALKSLGYSLPDRSVISKVVGTPFPKYYIDLGSSPEDTDKLVKIHREFQRSNFNLAKLFPNALETLKNLKGKGYKIAAVTSRSKVTSHQTLIDASIFDMFDSVISFEDAEGLKPNPAPLLKALENLGETPARAVMIGDSHLDIQAGKNAGTKTIRVTYGFHKDKLHEPEPDFFIDDIRDLLKLL